MVSIDRFKEDRIIELYNRMWAVISEKYQIAVDEAKRRFEIRALWSEDFDGHSESAYSLDWSTDGDQTTNAKTFNMQPVNKFEIVGLYGAAAGNTGPVLNYVRIYINATKIREYFGRLMTDELNGTYVFDDPFYVTMTQNLIVKPNTTGGSATTRFWLLGWVIKAR